METYILTVRQIVEVSVQDGAGRAAAVSALKSCPPMRKFNGGGFRIHTRDEIEIEDSDDIREMPDMQTPDVVCLR